MKSLLLASGIFFGVILTTVLGALFVDKALGDLEAHVDELIPSGGENTAKIRAAASEIEEHYGRIGKYIIFFICDDDASRIEEEIEEIKSYAMLGDVTGAIAAKNRLTLHLRQLRRFSRFSTEAVF